LILTADHGNDPIHHGTDHTREYVPLMIYTKRYPFGKKLPVFKTFSELGATINDNFRTEKLKTENLS
jgi:phosphopentomutase